MSEAMVLALVERCPNGVALARRARDGSLFGALLRLEALGLLWRQRDHYRLTRRGRDELAMIRALLQL
jgi:DNA-binding PadR family transcriptional regulator